jgi:hypothetical protein
MFQFVILLFESENWHFNSEICYLISKKVFDQKIDMWVLNYYFEILNIYFNSKKISLSFKGLFY